MKCRGVLYNCVSCLQDGLKSSCTMNCLQLWKRYTLQINSSKNPSEDLIIVWTCHCRMSENYSWQTIPRTRRRRTSVTRTLTDSRLHTSAPSQVSRWTADTSKQCLCVPWGVIYRKSHYVWTRKWRLTDQGTFRNLCEIMLNSTHVLRVVQNCRNFHERTQHICWGEGEGQEKLG